MFDDRRLNGLSAFMTVVQSGSYGAAAGRLGLTKSGISRAIKRLEDRTGLRLFDRTSRALKLTDAGRLFYDRALPLLDGLEQLAGGLSASDGLRGRLRVATDAAFGHYLLAPRLSKFLDRHRSLSVDLVVRDRIGDLLADGFDVAVRFATPELSEVERHFLFARRVLTCAAPACLARTGTPTCIDDLLKRTDAIRMIDANSGRLHDWVFEENGVRRTISPPGRMVLNDAGSIVAALLAGAGIGRPLDFTVEPYLRDGSLVEVLPAVSTSTWPAYAFYPRKAHRSPAIAAFVAFVQEVGAECPGNVQLPDASTRA